MPPIEHMSYAVDVNGPYLTQPNAAVTASVLREKADQMERQERKARKRAKAQAREAKAAAKRKCIALEALARVAQDESKGFASVEAAKALLAEQ